MDQAVLKAISDHFLDSTGFNGIALRALPGRTGLSEGEIKTALVRLIDNGAISVTYGDYHPNPHIKAFPPEPRDAQKEKLNSLFDHGCAYPEPDLLETDDRLRAYNDRPYTRQLALGQPQLDFRYFDLSVLENYRNDPRYYYETDDINGKLCITDDYYQDAGMLTRDRALIQSFSFGYDQRMNRAVAVCLRYLDHLTPEHQQIWRAKELTGTYHPHPEYYKNNIIGDFSDRISIFDAFLEELQTINAMCQAIKRPTLFREDFRKRPKDFAFLVRPTSKEYAAFVHLLDKMLSDNLNKKFFAGTVPLENETERSDGRILVTPKGTLSLLQDWLNTFQTDNRTDIDEAVETLKSIRTHRQAPAHRVDDNRFDQALFRQQRALMRKAYRAVKVLRLVMGSYPSADSVEISPYISAGKIVDF